MKRTIPRGKEKRKIGRPTLYDPITMIPIVLELMSQGLGRQEVCLRLFKAKGLWPSTIKMWEKKYPEFNLAIKNGEYLEEGWWKEQGRKSITDQFFNVGLYVVQMANRFGWRRKDDITQTIKGEVTQKYEYEHKFNFSNLEVEEVEQFRKIVAKGISKNFKPENLRVIQKALA